MMLPPLSATAAQLAHGVLEWAAIAIGAQLYRRRSPGGLMQPGRYAVVVGCILGAAVGNKLVYWIEYPHLWPGLSGGLALLLSGQSIVGGLLGGLLGVELAKKLIGSRTSTGDQFVLPLMAGMAVGRIGCFLAGLHDNTYGNPTTLPWGVDFGDGVARHPTQLYDIGFIVLWGGLLLRTRARWAARAGLMFKLYLSGYLLWRLGVDAIKPVPYAYPGQLSGIQWVCLLALACYGPLALHQLLRSHEQKNPALPVL
jgi:prolipoprotein diacylglyceryltransferase